MIKLKIEFRTQKIFLKKMDAEIARIINTSIKIVEENPDQFRSFRDWIDLGDSYSRTLFRFSGEEIPRERTKILLPALKNILEITKTFQRFRIRTQREILLFRETSYPERRAVTLLEQSFILPFSATNRTDTPGCFGEKTYDVKIPEGTPIFFLSAIDMVLRGMDFEETEQEFLILAETKLLAENQIEVLLANTL